MRARSLTLLAAAGALLTACGSQVDSGTVVDKHYEEPYTWHSMQCMPSGNNACATQLQIPHYEPEHYILTLENCDLREEGDDSCPQGRVYVDPGTYNEVELGDNFGGETTRD